jgi:hypothetical protein
MLYISQYVLHFIFWKKLDSPPPPLSSPLKGEETIEGLIHPSRGSKTEKILSTGLPIKTVYRIPYETYNVKIQENLQSLITGHQSRKLSANE